MFAWPRKLSFGRWRPPLELGALAPMTESAENIP
jgi:hypothetical protein